jgi:type II secretory pathway component PulM
MAQSRSAIWRHVPVDRRAASTIVSSVAHDLRLARREDAAAEFTEALDQGAVRLGARRHALSVPARAEPKPGN